MTDVRDACSSEKLSDVQIVLELFRAARNFQLTTVEQLVAECKQLFPDLPEERRRVCFGKLADMLEKNQ